MSTDSQSNNKRIAKNTLMLYVRMLIMMVIGLYTSRVILDKLGEVDFGIYNVVGGFVTMFTVISGAMTTATQRFLSFEIGKGRDGNVKSIFGTMIYIHIALALLIFIIGETLGLWFFNTKMNIPDDRFYAASWVFQLSLFTFILNVINVPYHGAMIAYEKMSAYAYFSIFDAIFKLLICYLITITPFDRLIIYAFLLALLQVIFILTYYIYCRFKFKECRFDGKINKEYLGQVGSFVSWNLIGSLAGVFKEQGVNVILNIYFGPAVNAARGVAYNVLSKVTGFVTNFQMAMNPQIIKNYAAGELRAMYKLVFQGAKLSYLLLMTLSLPLIVEAPLLLSVWLKEVPEYTVVFLRIILFTALLNSLSNTLVVSMHASGKVKEWQIVVGGASLLTIPLILIGLHFGCNPPTVMIIAFLVELGCHIIRVFMLKRILGFPSLDFLINVTVRVTFITFVALIPTWYVQVLVGNSIIGFFTVCVTSVLCSLVLGFYLGFNKEERFKIKTKSTAFIGRKFHK